MQSSPSLLSLPPSPSRLSDRRIKDRSGELFCITEPKPGVAAEVVTTTSATETMGQRSKMMH